MKKILVIPLFLTLFMIMFQSCDKNLSESEVLYSELEFSFSIDQFKSLNSQNLTHVLVTIEDLQGNEIKTLEKIEIFNMNGYYISKPISVVVGEYKLSNFIVIDDNNNVVLATPIEGSPKAYLVQEPLPILFSVQKDITTKLTPEVLRTSECHPEDFGYTTFSFEITETFDFLVGVFIYDQLNQNFKLTTGTISIFSNDALIYTGELLANNDISIENYDPFGITNKITLPIKYESFTIKVSKDGYNSYNNDFTKEELKLHYYDEDKGPLIIILDSNPMIPGLVAHYPFNGNANDESGNEQNGTDYGTAEYVSSSYNLARTFTNDPAVGVNATDYATIPNVINSQEFTINLWAKFQYEGNHQTIIYLSPGSDWVVSNLFFGVSPDMKLYAIHNGLDLRTIDYTHQALKNGQYHEVYLNSPSLELNKYYNITYTFKSSVVIIFVDGIEYAKYLYVNKEVGSPNVPIKLGVCAHPQAGFLYYPLVGQIDELSFYDRKLEINEIQSLYNE